MNWCTSTLKPPSLFVKPRSEHGLGMHHRAAVHCVLHLLDLGVTKHVLANAYWKLVYGGMVAGPTAKDRIDLVWGLVQEEYRKTKENIQIHRPGLSSFCDPRSPHADYPLMKGKGAEMRHLAPVTRIVWDRFARPDVPEDMHMSRVLQYLTQIYQVIDYKREDGLPPPVLPESVVLDLQRSIDRLLVHYSFLHDRAATAEAKARLLFNLVPKFHHLYHLGQEALYTNPRLGWTYSNEDWMSLIQRVGQAYRHGVPMSTRAGPMLRAWAVGQAVSLKYSRC